jgi:hypothetical protein
MRIPFLVLTVVVGFFFQACSHHESMSTATIGPEGGKLEGPNGVTLSVPEGALDSEIEISVTNVSGSPAGVHTLSKIYKFEPVGTEFSVPVSITLPYNSGKVVHQESVVRVWWGYSMDSTWVPLEGSVDTSAKTVTGTTDRLAFAASGDIEEELAIICHTAPDENCIVQVDTDYCLAKGVLDLNHPAFSGEPAYYIFPQVHNYMPTGDGDLDPMAVQLIKASISYEWIVGRDSLTTLGNDNLLILEEGTFDTYMSGVISAADSSGNPGIFITHLRAIPPDVGVQLTELGENADDFVLGVHVTISGTSLGGVDKKTNDFVHPIELCWGCLSEVCCTDPYTYYPACQPGQDDNSLLPCECQPID